MARSARARRSLCAVAAVALALGLSLAPPASADPLDDAKAAGYVGEQLNGMLGLVKKDAPSDVADLVASVNAKRLAHYESIAKKNSIAVAAVAARAGKKAIELTAPGHYIQNEEGAWVKK